MDLKRKPPYEAMFGLYNLLLAGIWLGTVPGRDLAAGMASAHLVLGVALFLLPPPQDHPGRGVQALRFFSPYLFWGLAWAEVGWLYRLGARVPWDGLIREWDLALAGTHLNQQLALWLPWAWFSEFMHFLYVSYYLLILGPVLYLVWRRRDILADHTASLMATYLACFAIYLALPVLGPRGFGDEVTVARGFFAGIMDSFFAAGDSLGTAFPSSHCAASLASALSARSFVSRPVARGLLVWALLIALATVYTNNHYAIDGIAGLALALTVWRIGRWHRSRQAGREGLGGVLLGSAGIVVGVKMGGGQGGGQS